MKKSFLLLGIFLITFNVFAESNKATSNTEIRKPANFNGDVRIKTQYLSTDSGGRIMTGNIIQIEDKENNIVCYGLQPNAAASAISCVSLAK